MAFIKRTVQSKSTLQIIFGVGTIFLSLGILGVLIYPQRQILLSYNWDINWTALVLSFVVFTIDLLVVALIWAWMMNAVGGKHSLLTHLRVYLVSHLARRLPGTVWYVASRMVLYKQENVSSKLTVVASGIELLVMMISGIIISLIFAVSIMATYGVGYGWFAAFAIVGAILLYPKTLRFLLEKAGVDLPPTLQLWNIIQWIMAYVFAWFLGGLVLYSVGNIIADIPAVNIPFLIGCWSIVGVVSTALIFFPSNLGVTEVGLSLLLTTLVPSPIAVVIALLARILLIVFEIFWAIIILGLTKKNSSGDVMASLLKRKLMR